MPVALVESWGRHGCCGSECCCKTSEPEEVRSSIRSSIPTRGGGHASAPGSPSGNASVRLHFLVRGNRLPGTTRRSNCCLNTFESRSTCCQAYPTLFDPFMRMLLSQTAYETRHPLKPHSTDLEGTELQATAMIVSFAPCSPQATPTTICARGQAQDHLSSLHDHSFQVTLHIQGYYCCHLQSGARQRQ